MRKAMVSFILIIGIGLTGLAEQTWEAVPDCPPDKPFTYCTVIEGSWTRVIFDESLARLALVSRRKLDVVSTLSGESLATLTPPSAWMEFTGLPVFSNDGSLVACPVNDGTVLVLDVEADSLAGTFPSQQRGFVAIFSQDGTLLMTQGELGEITLWSTETQQPLFSSSELNAYSYVIPVGFSDDDTFFLASGISRGSGWQSTGVWDMETRNLVRVFPGHVIQMPDGSLYTFETYFSGESSPDSDEPALVTSTRFSLWDGMFGDLVRTFTVPSPIWGASLSQTGQFLARWWMDGTIGFWDIEAEREIAQLDLKAIISDAAGLDYEDAMIHSALFSPDDSLLATVVWMSSPTSRTYVHLWNISDLLGDEN